MNYELANEILDNEKLRWCEIYVITCLVTNKKYVGQAVSHILNHKRYRPYGSMGRFKTHISEAFSNKKNQCCYLNNSIRKHNKESFKVELLERCTLDDADSKETEYINKLNTLFPNGYNLKLGGSVFKHSSESKKRLSEGVKNIFQIKSLKDFKNIQIPNENIASLIKPLNRHKQQYGWYVYINNIKADFGGVHINLDDSKKEAINFIKELQKRNIPNSEIPCCSGNPLEL
jgi:hypothetical protein